MTRWRIFGDIKYTETPDHGYEYIYDETETVLKVIKYEDWYDCPFPLEKHNFGKWIVVYKDGYDWCQTKKLTKLEKALK